MNRNRKIGTLTLGAAMVAAGTLFLVWNLVPQKVDIWFCLKFWPVMLILLGVETLWGLVTGKEEGLRYDAVAIVLLFILMGGCYLMALLWSMGEQVIHF